MLETIKQSLIDSNDDTYFVNDRHMRFLNEYTVPFPVRRMNVAKMGWAKQRTAGCLPFALRAMRIAGSKGAWVQRIIQGVLSFADLISFYTGQKIHSFVFFLMKLIIRSSRIKEVMRKIRLFQEYIQLFR